jgi:23S rRNA pseudouridine1911/1915/1917 synthase
MTADGETRRVSPATADEAGGRLDGHLARRVPGLSRTRIKALILAGRVSAGGATLSDPSERVKPGQAFAISVPDSVEAEPIGQAIPLDILHEDEDVIVIDKPAGLVVHPAAGNPDRTLVNALIAHCGDSLSGIGGVKRPGIVHRLDKDTSGLMVAAKNDAAHAALSVQFAERRVKRAYTAVAWGVPSPRAGGIEGNIGRSPANRKKMAVVRRGGKPARTRYRVLRVLGGDAAPIASVLECRLETGRTHQIRVHLAEKGHPLVGDRLYGRARGARWSHLGPEARRHIEGFGRQALDAHLLGFAHPRTNEFLELKKSLTADIVRLIEVLDGGETA